MQCMIFPSPKWGETLGPGYDGDLELLYDLNGSINVFPGHIFFEDGSWIEYDTDGGRKPNGDDPGILPEHASLVKSCGWGLAQLIEVMALLEWFDEDSGDKNGIWAFRMLPPEMIAGTLARHGAGKSLKVSFTEYLIDNDLLEYVDEA